MTEFPLKIVTPDGLVFDGAAEEVVVRTIAGDLGIMAKHMNCVAPLGMGPATIVTAGQHRHAACIGGMVTVVGGCVTLVPTTFEWEEDIDVARAEASEQRARGILNDRNASDTEIKLAQARLKRALVRKNVAK
ncbi:MAG: ATP synthase F1 subunit epsilon [Roseburia sp.]|nr:ATP synthase F1 subunit epsilon [Roseburia sp.]